MSRRYCSKNMCDVQTVLLVAFYLRINNTSRAPCYLRNMKSKTLASPKKWQGQAKRKLTIINLSRKNSAGRIVQVAHPEWNDVNFVTGRVLCCSLRCWLNNGRWVWGAVRSFIRSIISSNSRPSWWKTRFNRWQRSTGCYNVCGQGSTSMRETFCSRPSQCRTLAYIGLASNTSTTSTNHHAYWCARICARTLDMAALTKLVRTSRWETCDKNWRMAWRYWQCKTMIAWHANTGVTSRDVCSLAQHFRGAKLRLECYVKIRKCQWIMIITIEKMFNANGCYPVAKSHKDHHVSKSEQLRTFVTFQGIVSVSSNQCSHVVWLRLRHSAFS